MKYKIIKETRYNSIPIYHLWEWVTKKSFIFRKEVSYWKHLEDYYNLDRAKDYIKSTEFIPQWEVVDL